ncbi:hypothetical protein D9M68_868070 [compost metagenome]
MGRPTMKKPMNTANASGRICAKTERAGPWAEGMAPAADRFDMDIPWTGDCVPPPSHGNRRWHNPPMRGGLRDRLTEIL